MKFKIGDHVVCKKKYNKDYVFTRSNAVCKILKVVNVGPGTSGPHYTVAVIGYKDHPSFAPDIEHISNRFLMREDHLRIAKKQEVNSMLAEGV